MKLNQQLLYEISEILESVLQGEIFDKLKLAESFAYSYYTAAKYSKTKRIMNFQISDESFLFSVNINMDDQGNIILFNIKKEMPLI